MQETSVIGTLFRSLRHRNFRLFWSGQLISLIGTWMQNVGQAWLVLELTHSSFKLGEKKAGVLVPHLSMPPLNERGNSVLAVSICTLQEPCPLSMNVSTG